MLVPGHGIGRQRLAKLPETDTKRILLVLRTQELVGAARTAVRPFEPVENRRGVRKACTRVRVQAGAREPLQCGLAETGRGLDDEPVAEGRKQRQHFGKREPQPPLLPRQFEPQRHIGGTQRQVGSEGRV